MEALEKIVKFDEDGNTVIHLGKQFSKKSAKILVLFEDDEIAESDWLGLAAKGTAYDFLLDPKEDIYSMEDGVPYKRGDDEV